MKKIAAILALSALLVTAAYAATIPPSISLFSSIGDLPVTRGTVTINGVTPVTVVAPLVTPNSFIDFTLKTVGGTVGGGPTIETITPGVGFTVQGTAGDTSTYVYIVLF